MLGLELDANQWYTYTSSQSLSSAATVVQYFVYVETSSLSALNRDLRIGGYGSKTGLEREQFVYEESQTNMGPEL